MRTSHLNALRALEAALRLGGFRAAADELGVTPAAVGQHIRTLEAWLGTSLFERTPRGTVPTEAARRVAQDLTGAFGQIGRTLDALRQGGDDRRVAISATPAMAEIWLPPRLPGFFALAREVDLRLDTRRSLVDLRQGEFDFAIRHAAEAGDGHEAIDLFASELLPVCTPGFAAAHGLGRETRSLAAVPVGQSEIRTSDPGWADWAGWCARFGVAPPDLSGAPRIGGDAGGSAGLAISGLALTLSDLAQALGPLRDGRLVAPFGAERSLRTAHRYRLIWHADRRLGRTQALFRDWIAARAAEDREALADWRASALRDRPPR